MASLGGNVQAETEEFVDLGGKVKASDVVGTIGTLGSVLPGIGPAVGAIGAIGKGILKLFGGSINGSGLTQKEMNVLMEIQRRVQEREKRSRKGRKGRRRGRSDRLPSVPSRRVRFSIECFDEP